MKTANEILADHGINLLNFDDEFNSQLLHAMERYSEQFLNRIGEKSRIKILNEVAKEYKQESYLYAIKHCLPSCVLNIALEAMKRYKNQFKEKRADGVFKN